MNTDIEIIAEFMGGVKTTNHPDCKHFSFTRNEDAIQPNNEGIYTLSMLKGYYSTWNCLMQLVGKIESITLDVKEDNYINITIGHGLECTIQDIFFKHIDICVCEASKFDSVLKACVMFIKWYNKFNLVISTLNTIDISDERARKLILINHVWFNRVIHTDSIKDICNSIIGSVNNENNIYRKTYKLIE